MGFPSDSYFSFSHLTNKVYPVLGTCWVFVLPWNFPISMSPMILDMTNDKRHDMPKKPNPDALGDTWVNPYMNTRRSHMTDFAHKRWFKVVWWGNGHFFHQRKASSISMNIILQLDEIPSRELTYPTWGRGKSTSKVAFLGDMLVPRRVC